MKILIIEDEKELGNDIAKYLVGEEYICEYATTYSQAIEKINTYVYDCILLDITLPDGNGIDILEHLKKLKKQDGVIIISAKDALDDKIRGLQLGADDYLTKPFHLSELAARIFSVIRRKQFDNANIITQNEIKVDLIAKSIFVKEQKIDLTKTEFDLLLFFMGNKNKVISKSILAEHLSGDFDDMLDNHDFIYAHIKNLKKKLKVAGSDSYLKTVYGTGYKWEA
jgi:DNA-binding response OmpR family regulator